MRPTAGRAVVLLRGGGCWALNFGVGQIKAPKWAKSNCQNQFSTELQNGLPYVFRIDCFGLPWRDSGGIGDPLCWLSNRRLSSNGIVKGFGFFGAGNRRLVARDG